MYLRRLSHKTCLTVASSTSVSNIAHIIHSSQPTITMSSCSFTNYVYTPLQDPDNCVRLLKLLPLPANHQQGCWGELITCRRDEAPPFRPVSYTWGLQDASSQIFLRDAGRLEWRRFCIRPNLDAFLRQLFRRLDSEFKIFWIDAICINQDDNKEKGCQVRNMDKIYRDRDISIWLGDSSENSDLALDLVDELTRCIPYKSDGSLAEEASDVIHEFLASKLNPIWADSWRALIDLISRPWFTRRWIVQEYVLSKHKHAYLGSRDLCFQFIYLLCVYINMFPYPLREGAQHKNFCEEYGFSHGLPAPTLDPLENLSRLQAAHEAVLKGQTSDLTLERLLDNFSGFQSHDPRDGIYAFLSIASDIDRSEWTPDYSIKTTILYTQAVIHIIRNSNSLDIICRRIHIPEFASSVTHESRWVPWFGLQKLEFQTGHIHWIHGYNTRSLTTFGQSLATLRMGQPDYRPSTVRNTSYVQNCDGCDTIITRTGYRCMDCPELDYCYKCIQTFNHDPAHRFEIHNKAVYCASGRSAAMMERFILGPSLELFEHHSVKLRAPGFIVDSIRAVGKAAATFRTFDSTSVDLPLADWAALPGAEKFFNEHGVPEDIFFRALTGNRLVSDGRVCHLPAGLIPAIRRTLCSDTETDTNGEPYFPSLEVMLSNFRRFCTTLEQSLGFVPYDTRESDCVAIIRGCSVPVIIRQLEAQWDNTSKWMLVGECYVDGIMDGEYLDVVDRDGVKPQIFTII